MINLDDILIENDCPVEAYLNNLDPGQSKKKARFNLLRVSREFGAAHYHDVPWGKLTYAHATALKAKLNSFDYSPGYINLLLCATRGVIRAARDMELMEDRRASKVLIGLKNIKGSRLPPGRLVENWEIKKILEVCTADEHERGLRDAVIIYCLRLGLRSSEVLALRVNDVLIEDKKGVLKVSGKNNKERRVPIPEKALKNLLEWIEILMENSTLSREDQHLNVALWQGWKIQHKKGLTYSGLRFIIGRLQELASVEKFCIHSLRRTFISYIIEVSDLATAQKLAGHASMQTTASYDRRPESRQRQAVEEWANDW